MASVASSEALVPWKQHAELGAAGDTECNQKSATSTADPHLPDPEPEPLRLLVVPFVELALDNVPCRVAKIMVPTTSATVPQWWSDEGEADVRMAVDRPEVGAPQLYIEILSKESFVVGGSVFHGIYAVVTMPEDDVDLERCHVGTTSVHYDDIPGLQELGSIGALYVVCPLKQSELRHASMLEIARSVLSSGHPLRWLLIPTLILLVPFVLGSGPAALIVGACLVLAVILGCMFVVTVVSITVKRTVNRVGTRIRRNWHLRSLARRAPAVEEAFGAQGPCCICLGDPMPGESVIVLLPCKHALHDSCYRGWVCADAYAPLELICPLCRCSVLEIGQLALGKHMHCAPCCV